MNPTACPDQRFTGRGVTFFGCGCHATRCGGACTNRPAQVPVRLGVSVDLTRDPPLESGFAKVVSYGAFLVLFQKLSPLAKHLYQPYHLAPESHWFDALHVDDLLRMV